mgnify:CR=1 FL=1|eukprot:scaffold105562_cov30-Tisochrysis_lutea.AAC.4
MLRVFCKDGKGGWQLDVESIRRADEVSSAESARFMSSLSCPLRKSSQLAPTPLSGGRRSHRLCPLQTGCGFKTERGDRSAVIMTPESGKFSQMMLNVTRSLGDFYHQVRWPTAGVLSPRLTHMSYSCDNARSPAPAQQYGITWRPEVVVRDLAAELGADGEAVLCVASDGVWDLWTFEDAMAELVKGMALLPASNARRQLVLNFMDTSRAKGEEAFGDSADNLTGIVVFFSTK